MEKFSLEGLKNYEIPIGRDFILDSREKIGFGSFGDVYSGRIRGNGQPIAIKLEQIHKEPTIFNESNFLIHFNEIERIPKLIWVGKQGNYNILIMNLLGSSLKNLMKICQGKFSLATTLKISIQILEILRQIHDKGVVLRYLKPGNMVIGVGDNKNFVYLIDFGISKYYSYNGMHIPYNSHKTYIKGNRDFISININNNIESSRRDDIESLGYNLVYFMKGILPWSKDRDEEIILHKKINTSLDRLCEGLPYEFKEFISYARKLEFTERPNYYYLKGLLIRAAKKNGINLDKVEYDWIILERKEIKDNKIKNEIDVKQNEIKESKNDSKEKEINKEAKEDKKLDENKNKNKVETKDNNESKMANKKVNEEVNKQKNMEVNKEEIKEENRKEDMDKYKEINREETKDENKIEDIDENKKLNKEENKDENKKEDNDENKELNKEECKEENKNEDIYENKELNKEEWKEENQILINEELNNEKEKNLENYGKEIQESENS